MSEWSLPVEERAWVFGGDPLAGYYDSQYWKQLQHKVLVEADFTCWNCFGQLPADQLVAHHTNYHVLPPDGEQYCDASDLECWCRDCHEEFHAMLNRDWAGDIEEYNARPLDRPGAAWG
jgi:hypothetical protein